MAAMATVKSSTLTCLVHHLLRFRKPKSPVCLFLRPFSMSVLVRKSIHHNERRFPYIFASLPLSRRFMPHSSLLAPKSFSSVDDSDQDNNDEEDDVSDRTMVSMRESGRSSEISEEVITQIAASKLSAKEKKKLASYAHRLGDKLKCQLVGKSGVTDSVVFSFIETLEKNELVKVKIHRTCPGELEDTILHLEEATGSVSVGQIGQTVILYRPSLTN